MSARRILTLLIALCLTCLTAVQPTQAQTVRGLLPFTPLSGTLGAGETHSFTFSGQSGAVVSLVVSTPESALDSALALIDSSGRVIAGHDDRLYPDDLDPLLQAVTLPRTDTYTAALTSVNGTSGAYTIQLIPGFGRIDQIGFSTNWAADGAEQNASAERIILSIEGARARGVSLAPQRIPSADFYAQVDVIAVSSQSGTWTAGIAFRDDGEGAHYEFIVSERGVWRLLLVRGESEQVLRDWTPHPALIAGDTAFTLGVLAIGSTFDFFYDNTFIGTSSDETLSGAGGAGIVGGTPTPLPTLNQITYANWGVTLPETVPGGAALIPDTVMTAADGQAMVTMLRRLFPSAAPGTMRLTLPESLVQYARGGINRFGVGRGAQYQNFILGAQVTLETNPLLPAGCGVSVRGNGIDAYTLAYFNAQGEYGLARRQGEGFAPGLYGVRAGLGTGEHHLLILAMDNTLYLYIDGRLAGSHSDPHGAGDLGMAVVNFEPTPTTCRARNLWLWSWDR
jgi:hypothetical protein